MSTNVKSSSFLISATPVTIVAHLLGITATALVLVWTFQFREGITIKSGNKQKIFNVHPMLMIIGFIFFGEATMAYKTVHGTRKVQKFVHTAWHLIALLVGGLGIYAVFKFHKEAKIPDIYTLHSWLGMGTISFFALQWLIGFIFFWFPGTAMTTRAIIAPWHTFAGMVILLMAICSAETGLVERFIFLGLQHGKEALVVNVTGLAILLYGIAVTLTILLPRSY